MASRFLALLSIAFLLRALNCIFAPGNERKVFGLAVKRGVVSAAPREVRARGGRARTRGAREARGVDPLSQLAGAFTVTAFQVKLICILLRINLTSRN